MTVKKMDSGYCPIAALRYGEVLYSLGISEEAAKETGEILRNAPELLDILSHPFITAAKKQAIIERIFPVEIQKFLKVVSRHGKIKLIQEILYAYSKKLARAKGQVTAKLWYVAKPSGKQLALMEQFVKQQFHADNVVWDMEKELDLIGGFILNVNGREYDYSMQGRLKRLEEKLTWR